jgi:hypothetical protein
MSIFEPINVSCPACGATVEFEAVFSLNADRRPDLRDAVLDRSFQEETCSQCGEEFRLDPEMTYIDMARGQWIAAFPYAKLGQWKALEEQARATFNRAYGEKASAAAREIGAGLKPRITFGWAALREKLVIAGAELDDIVLELMKTAMVRGMETPPIGAGTELRLEQVEGDQLVIAWIKGANEELKEVLRVPRSLYDEIAANLAPWEALRASLTSGLFVDVNRLLLPPAATA